MAGSTRGGRTLPRLTALIGGEEGVFGPMIAQLLPLVDALREVARTAPPRVRGPITRMAGGYDELNRLRGLAAGLGNGGGARGGLAPVGFATGARVFGFTGVDDAAAAATLAAMALILGIFLILLTQSPAFRREVQVRAKELDRIMRNLQINANTGLKDAIVLIVTIVNGEIEEQNRCKQSPTFLASAQCAEAFREFAAIVARIGVQVASLEQLLLNIIRLRERQSTSLFVTIQTVRAKFDTLLKAAQQETVNLQVALANMREVCKCPDI